MSPLWTDCRWSLISFLTNVLKLQFFDGQENRSCILTFLSTWKISFFSRIFRGEYSVRVPSGPSRLSFFKIWPFSAEFHITYMYDIFIYLAKIMLLRENLFMAEFFNSHQKLCQGTNDKKLIHIHNLYTPKLKRKPKDCFRSVTLGMLT